MADSRDLRIRVILDAVQKVTGPLRQILGGSKATATGLKAVRDRIKALDRTAADVKTFVHLKQQARAAGPAMAQAEKRVADLAARLKAADGPARKLNAEFKKAKQTASDLRRQHQDNGRELQVLRDRLSQAGIKTTDLAAGQRRLKEATEHANRELKVQQDRLKAMGARDARLNRLRAGAQTVRAGGAATTAAGAATGAAGAGLLAPILGAAAEARDFESTMTSIAQKADMSRKDAEAMGRRLIATSDRLKVLPEQLQAGMEVITARGLDARIAEGLITPMAKASRAYKVEMEDLGVTAFAVYDNLKIKTADVGQAMDQLAMADKLGGVGFADLARGLPSLTALFQGLGQAGLKANSDLAAASEIALKAAGSPDEAVNNLRNLLLKINSPETQKDFAKFGINFRKAMDDAKAAGESPIETFVKLSQLAQSKGANIGDLIQDQQAQLALQALTQNLEQYRDIRAKIAGSKGVVDRDLAERIKDGAEQVKSLSNELHNLKLEQGDVISKEIVGLANMFAPIVHDFREFAKANPWVIKLAAGLGLLLAVVGAVLIVVGGLALAFGAVMAGIAALGGGAVVGTVVGLVAAFAAFAFMLGEAAKALVRFLEGVFKKVDLVAVGKALMQGLITGIKAMFPFLGAIIDTAAKMLPKGLRDRLGIKSPSRVFAEIGGHTMGGLAVGIRGGARHPLQAARQVAGGLAAAASIGASVQSVAFAAPSPVAAGRTAPAVAAQAAPTYNITINPLPGMDEAALARLVRAELQKLQHGQQAARRSSFSDYGED